MKSFVKLANHVGVVALDIGARGGPNNDLADLAPAIDMYCFEPDEEEYNQISNSSKGPWKSITFIPSAVAAHEETFSLNLYRQRGCSSRFKADSEMAALFNREDYYVHDGCATVSAKSLDQLVSEHQIANPAFLKIDVQGMEIDCFSGAKNVLANSLVGIRSEVSFFPVYKGNPLFSDVDKALNPYGFVPMRWLELHEWRRTTRAKWPKTSPGKMPYSRGQMIHADVLYLLHPEKLPDTTDEEVKRLIRLALVAICYEHFDHAHAVFTRQQVYDYILETAGFDPVNTLEELSKSKARSLSGLNRYWNRLTNADRR